MKKEIDYSAIINEAFQKAAEATEADIKADPDNWYPCGFAWVKIKPARGPLVKYLKDNKLGTAGYNGGFEVYNPSNNPTQRMYAKIAGAKAFVEVIKPYVESCYVESRID